VNAYLLLPLVACVSSTMLTMAILARDSRHSVNRIGAVLTSGAAIWAFCEVLWNSASNPSTVHWLVRVSSIGWVAIGPLGLHLFLEVTGAHETPLRRALPALYAVSAIFLAIALGTDWIHPGVERSYWGWAYQLGPAYGLFYVFTVSCLLVGLALGVRDVRSSTSPGERSQARLLMVGILVPLVVASLTDGLLPLFGVQVPRLGTASFTILGGTIAWAIHHYGYSLLVPGAFASEILGTLPDGVALLRLDGRVRSANSGMARLAGRSARQLQGLPLLERIRDLDRDPASEPCERECWLESWSAGAIPVSVSISVLRDKQHSPIGLVLVARDLREVANLRRRLLTAGRLAAVGELAAGIAHEINNPIAFVHANLGSLGKLQQSIGALLPTNAPPELRDSLREGRELVEESLDGVDRVIAIVRDVKAFSHAGGGPREFVALNPLLDSVLRVARPQLGANTPIERHYGEIPPVQGASPELMQVFLNLIINASHAVRDDEAIRLYTGLENGRVVVRIEDEGCGIEPGVLERVFDPFFTTKPVGDGTGLGLAISYRIVRDHGGDLGVDSQPGRGTCFRVELPAVVPDEPPAE